MSAPRTQGILDRFGELPEEISIYLEHFPKLAKEFPWNVSIGYLFAQIELAHNMTIYGGVVKLHRVDSSLARTAVDNHYLSRNNFRDLFKAIFDKPLKSTIAEKIEQAETVRDKILHGKKVTESEKREAVVAVLDYAAKYNDELDKLAGFRPFGSLQGYKGRGQSLDKSTSRWILKGIGLTSV